MRRRVHLQAGDSVVLDSSDDRAYASLIVTGFHIDTDGTNAATLTIADGQGTLTAPGGFVVVGAAEAGGISNIHPESGRMMYPVTMTLAGTGSSATVFCFEGV